MFGKLFSALSGCAFLAVRAGNSQSIAPWLVSVEARARFRFTPVPVESSKRLQLREERLSPSNLSAINPNRRAEAISS